MSQLDLFGRSRPAPPVPDVPDPADVRAEMHAALAELEGAQAMPWPEREVRVWRIVWPQMMQWLPPSEHAGLQSRFDAEVARLGG